jgi:hypothetical protein
MAVVEAPITDVRSLKKADAKTQYTIDIYISDMNRERVKTCLNAKNM